MNKNFRQAIPTKTIIAPLVAAARFLKILLNLHKLTIVILFISLFLAPTFNIETSEAKSLKHKNKSHHNKTRSAGSKTKSLKTKNLRSKAASKKKIAAKKARSSKTKKAFHKKKTRLSRVKTKNLKHKRIARNPAIKKINRVSKAKKTAFQNKIQKVISSDFSTKNLQNLTVTNSDSSPGAEGKELETSSSENFNLAKNKTTESTSKKDNSTQTAQNLNLDAKSPNNLQQEKDPISLSSKVDLYDGQLRTYPNITNYDSSSFGEESRENQDESNLAENKNTESTLEEDGYLQQQDSIPFSSKVDLYDGQLQASFYDKFNDKSVAVFEVMLGKNLILSSGMVSYFEDGRIFVPFFEFCENIEFPIDPGNDYADVKGWFIDEKRKFLFDLVRGRSIANNKEYKLTPDNVRVVKDEVYVEIGLLQDWFPIKIEFDQNEQLLQVTSTEKLPIEEDFERSQRWDGMMKEKTDQIKTFEIDKIKSGYAAASIPITDLRLRFQTNRTKESSYSSKQGEAFIRGDFLYFNHQIFGSFLDDKISNLRITSSRKDPDGKILGPLQATSLSFGDVFNPQSNLISRSQQGKGLAISNLPENYVSEDIITINGMMNAGWDVEIYRNDFLVDFKKVGADGSYSFQNVNLNSGLNTIKLVFYGPFGQKKQEIRKYLLNEDLVKKNKIYYNFSINKDNQTIFSSINNGNINNAEDDPRYGHTRRFGEITYGLARNTSVAATFVSIPLINAETQQHEYQGLSFRSSIFGIYGRQDFVKDRTDGQTSNKTSLQTKILEYNLTLDREKYDKKFISENHQASYNPLVDQLGIKANGPFKMPYLEQDLNLNISYTQTKFANKELRKDSQGEISANVFSRLGINQFIREIYDQRISGTARKTAIGRTLLNLKATPVLSIRNMISYDIKPKKTVTSNNSGIDYNFGDGITLNLNHIYQFPQLNQKSTSSYSINFNKALKKYILGFSSSYSNNGNYTAGINIFTSLGYDAKYGIGILSGTSLGNSSILSVRAFLDKNSNDLYDKEDELLEGISISVENVPTVKTNKKGVALITGIQPEKTLRVTLLSDSLADPFWLAKKPQFDISTHAGSIQHVDFPISLTGEIEGYAKFKDGDDTFEASNVELEIVDSKGNIYKTTKSSFDGFYNFSGVAYGKYKIRTSAAQSQRLGIESDIVYDVEVSDKSQSSLGFNFEIRKENIKDTNVIEKNFQKNEIKEQKNNKKKSRLASNKKQNLKIITPKTKLKKT